MKVPSRALAWSLGILTVGLVVIAVLAMTGAMGLDETVIGSYTGFHVIGVLVAAAGMLALVAALLRGTRA